MLDKFYYENNQGETLTFGENGIFANYNDLRDYEWTYSSGDDVIMNFRRGVTKKTLPAIFVGRSGQDCRTARNNAYVIVERDVLAGKKGKLHVGEYYMNCWIYGISNTEYLKTERMMKSSFLVCTDEPVWRKETTFEFIPGHALTDYGVDFPFDFPFDYQNSPLASKNIKNDFIFGADFRITFYGEVESPSIKINDHTYGMTCSVETGERIVVDSLTKTIKKYGVDNSSQNYFNYRYKQESIFEKIPYGMQKLAWNGQFGFDITLIDGRSEPKWTFTEYSTGDISDVVEIGEKYYLLDSNGDYILDNDGDYITVSSPGREGD